MDRYEIQYCSPGQITQYLGLQFKNYRILSKITQKEIAEKTSISVTTIHKFETGQLYNMSLRTLFLLLKSIGQTQGLIDILPDISLHAYLVNQKTEKKVQRIRHKKND